MDTVVRPSPRPDAGMDGGAVGAWAADEAEHHYADANGFRLHYLVTGQGPPAVLIHGEAASVADSRWAIPGLARLLRVYALDLRGHGESSKPDAPYSAPARTGVIQALQEIGAVGLRYGGTYRYGPSATAPAVGRSAIAIRARAVSQAGVDSQEVHRRSRPPKRG